MNIDFPAAAFWSIFQDRHPEERDRRARKSGLWWQRSLPRHSLVLTLFLSPEVGHVGVFLGENKALGATDVNQRLTPFEAELAARIPLRPEHQLEGFPVRSIWPVDCTEPDNWPAMSDWLVTEASRFERSLDETLA